MPSSSSEPSGIGLPQIAACLLIGYLIFRWYSSSPTTATGQSSSANTRAVPRRAPTPAEATLINSRAELVSGMFPQIPLAAIKWELQKNGANVEATTEKILTNGFLPEPPAPANPSPASSSRPSRTNAPSTVTNASTSATSTGRSSNNAHIDLITRYNLSNKLAESAMSNDSDSGSASPSGSGKGKASAWSQNKAERQALLQKRRDEMILKARRRMEEQAAEAREEVAKGMRQQ